jgi:hypothetical protein
MVRMCRRRACRSSALPPDPESHRRFGEQHPEHAHEPGDAPRTSPRSSTPRPRVGRWRRATTRWVRPARLLAESTAAPFCTWVASSTNVTAIGRARHRRPCGSSSARSRRAVAALRQVTRAGEPGTGERIPAGGATPCAQPDERDDCAKPRHCRRTPLSDRRRPGDATGRRREEESAECIGGLAGRPLIALGHAWAVR